MHIRRQLARYTRVVFGVVLCVLLGTVLIGLPQPGTGAERQAAPSFSLQDILGRERSLAEHRGKVVLINFWATSCPPCIHEMPSLESLYHSLKDKGFVVVAVASDVAGERTVKPVVDRLRLTFPILLDPKSKITVLYGVSFRPTSYLIDRQGFLVSRTVGARDWMSDDQLASIRALLPASPPID